MSQTAVRPFDAVVFDLDGTLVDTAALHIAASHHAARVVLGRDVSSATVRHSLGRPLPESMAVVAEGAGLAAHTEHFAAVPALVAAFLEYYATHQSELARPFPGVQRVLAHLRERGYVLALLSNKLHDWGRAELDALDLARHFAVTVFAEDMPVPKPAGAALEPVLAALGIAPARVLLVGDGAADIGCARAAGAVSAAALWGAVSPQALLALAPDFALPSIDELLALCPAG